MLHDSFVMRPFILSLPYESKNSQNLSPPSSHDRDACKYLQTTDRCRFHLCCYNKEHARMSRCTAQVDFKLLTLIRFTQMRCEDG